jgi:hypothetical protein
MFLSSPLDSRVTPAAMFAGSIATANARHNAAFPPHRCGPQID